jgi:hypothetical protein
VTFLLYDTSQRVSGTRKNEIKRRTHMETWYYEVVSIDGDYANLRRTDIDSDDLKLVARALLPAEIVEGSKLKYELMQYQMM